MAETARRRPTISSKVRASHHEGGTGTQPGVEEPVLRRHAVRDVQPARGRARPAAISRNRSWHRRQPSMTHGGYHRDVAMVSVTSQKPSMRAAPAFRALAGRVFHLLPRSQLNACPDNQARPGNQTAPAWDQAGAVCINQMSASYNPRRAMVSLLGTPSGVQPRTS